MEFFPWINFSDHLQAWRKLFGMNLCEAADFLQVPVRLLHELGLSGIFPCKEDGTLAMAESVMADLKAAENAPGKPRQASVASPLPLPAWVHRAMKTPSGNGQ